MVAGRMARPTGQGCAPGRRARANTAARGTSASRCPECTRGPGERAQSGRVWGQEIFVCPQNDVWENIDWNVSTRMMFRQ